MNKIVAGLGTLALLGGLAACGTSTHTTTVVPGPTVTAAAPAVAPAQKVVINNNAAPAPAQPVVVPVYVAPPAPALTSCGGDLYVNADTSCPFAENVETDYTGLGPDYANSPVTGLSYTMECVAGYGNLNGGDSVVCTGGINALVEWGAS